MALSPGTRLGTFQITGPLGSGGMGEVYRARDTRLGREVAVKVLPEAVTSSADRLARFEREARIVAGLSHPNIVTLFSVEHEEGLRFLTMELVQGRSLDRLIAPGGMPVAGLLDIAIPLAGALVGAHERGIVHRDLKPGNVMVTDDGWVKVLDFGLAKAGTAAGEGSGDDATIGGTIGTPLSGEGQVLGTIPYMAPEQLRGEVVDARCDLFALGIILYELATGRRPFTGAATAEITSAILRDTPPAPAALRADLPRDLNRIILRCLEKNPRDRFQTARDVHNELRYVKREIESGDRNAAATGPERAAASGATGATPSPAPAASPGGASSSRTPAFAASAPPAAARDIPSIAVLPFVNRSRDEEDVYFSDGLAEELLNVLTKVRGLRVAARASSFQFRGTNEDLAMIGGKLNVATLLDGSVRKSGSRVRISVQLVRAADRELLWSETYDRSLDDIFAVQDDIAQCVVKELRSALLGVDADSDARRRAEAEIAAAGNRRVHDPEAHRLYLQGKYLVERTNPDDNERGIGYLREALALDPSHAEAWTALAGAYINSAGYGWEPLFAGYRKAREAVERALELAPDLAQAYVTRSRIQTLHDWDWVGAERSARRALELAPGSAEVLHTIGNLAHRLGRFEEAEPLLLQAVEKDPLSPSAYSALGSLYRSMDRPGEAEQAYRKVIELAPQRISTYTVLSALLAEQGRVDEATAVARREPASWARLTALAYVHHLAGRREDSDEALAQLKERHASDSAIQIAIIHAARGETDDAFAWLDRALTERDAGTPLIPTEPAFRSLHADARWAPLLRRLGFAT